MNDNSNRLARGETLQSSALGMLTKAVADSRLSPSPYAIEDAAPFSEAPISLSDADVAGAGKVIPLRGVELIYRRSGSVPGGRLVVQAGREINLLAPGDRIEMPFTSLVIRRHAQSSKFGTANLMMRLRADAKFTESNDAALSRPAADLLGDSVAGTFIAIAKDTDPSGAAPVGSFDVTGWSKVQLLIDTLSAAANATTFDIVPWWQPPGQTQWFEQGSQRISVPDTDTTGGRYRIVQFTTSGPGLYYPAIRNLLAVARTGLAFIAQGLN